MIIIMMDKEFFFFFSSRRRHTRWYEVTGVQTCALPISLRHFRATTVNVAALGEPVGATLLAWIIPAIHEVPRVTALGGGLLALIGIWMSLGAGSGERYPPGQRKVPLPAPSSRGGGDGSGHAR